MKTAVKIGAFLLIFVLLLGAVTEVLRDKTNAEFLYPFREEPDHSLDVLFIGSSHCYAHVSCMELWREHGIASYNLGTSEQTLAQSYWLLRYALDRQSPRLVVLELYMLNRGVSKKGGVSLARDHQVADNLENSADKARYIFHTVEPEDWAEFFFPIIAYHDRWQELRERDFQRVTHPLKGSNFRYNTAELAPEDISPVNREETAEISARSREWVEKIAELCREKDVRLLLLATPYPDTASNRQLGCFNAAFSLAGELGVEYLYLMDAWDELGLDAETDFSDSSHLNLAGSIKVTDRIGAFIRETYAVPDRRGDPAYGRWEENYADYLAYVEPRIRNNPPEQAEYLLSVFRRA